MMKYTDTVVIVFAKAPVPGRVNTRLIPVIGEEAAARLQYDLIHQRLSLLTQAKLCEVMLYCSPDTGHSCFRECADEYSIDLVEQKGVDLGARMANAIKEQSEHFNNVIILGTDAPALELDRIEEAIITLQEGKEAVVVPASDGGYVLIGMSQYYEALFISVPWGTDRVLIKTRGNSVAAGLKLVELEECWDIDTPEDYARYKQSL